MKAAWQERCAGAAPGACLPVAEVGRSPEAPAPPLSAGTAFAAGRAGAGRLLPLFPSSQHIYGDFGFPL